MNEIEIKLKNELNPILQDKGYYIKEISYNRIKNKRSKLLLIIENINNNPITINDCSIASKNIALIIDVNNLITEPYNLEVSSKGCDDSLIFFKDFIKNIGKTIKVNFISNNKEYCVVATITRVIGNRLILKKNEDLEKIIISIKDIKRAVLIKDRE